MFGHLAVFNAVSFWKIRVRREHSPSGVPFVGGVLGGIGLWLLPVPAISHFAWAALLLDYGCLPYTVGVSLYLAHDAYIHSRRFLVMHLEGQHTNGTKSVLKLYRNGDCVLTQTDMPLPTVHLSMLGEWREDADLLVVDMAKDVSHYARDETKSQYEWLPASDAGPLDGTPLRIVWKAS